MDIEFDYLRKTYFLKFEYVLEYWGRDPSTFGVLGEGEELFYRQLVVCCGVTKQTVFNIMTYGIVCDDDSKESVPCEVRATLNFHGLDNDIGVKEVVCDRCKENDKKCKHVAAMLVYLNRHDISVIPELVGKDLKKYREKMLRSFYSDKLHFSDDEEEEEPKPFTYWDGCIYDNSEGIPPREPFHMRVCKACDEYQAEKKGEKSENSEDDDEDTIEDSD